MSGYTSNVQIINIMQKHAAEQEKQHLFLLLGSRATKFKLATSTTLIIIHQGTINNNSTVFACKPRHEELPQTPRNLILLIIDHTDIYELFAYVFAQLGSKHNSCLSM